MQGHADCNRAVIGRTNEGEVKYMWNKRQNGPAGLVESNWLALENIQDKNWNMRSNLQMKHTINAKVCTAWSSNNKCLGKDGVYNKYVDSSSFPVLGTESRAY